LRSFKQKYSKITYLLPFLCDMARGKKKSKVIEYHSSSEEDEQEQQTSETRQSIDYLSDNNENDQNEFDNNQLNEDFENDDYPDVPKGFGMADVISKVLNQRIKSKNPVLAKRKTKIMKDIEATELEEKTVKETAKERRKKRQQQLSIPDHTTMDYERQLRKIGTRGVVTLFNAIAKHQREIAALRDENGSDNDELATQNLSKNAFIEMLKTSKNPNSITKTMKQQQKQKKTEENEKSKWAAVQDDYLMKSNFKDWDKESDNSGSDESDLPKLGSFSDNDNENGKDNSRKRKFNKHNKKSGSKTKNAKKVKTSRRK